MTQDQFEQAVRNYWTLRELQAAEQAATGQVDAGTRGEATGGGHFDPIVELLEQTFIEAGVPPASVRRSTGVELPGFYRPTKKWNLVVVDRGRLIAAIELKSQAGPSFGNNFNNRIEEALGSATDIWEAYEKNAFGDVRPWLGYLFLLEDSPRSTAPVRLPQNPLFPVDPVFHNTSYKDRYRILCKRLLHERLYDAVCFVTASKDLTAAVNQPDREFSFASFVAAIRGRTKYIEELPY